MMQKTMKKGMFLAGALMFALSAAAPSIAGIQGECSDCHTMHNSYSGEPVAVQGVGGETQVGANQNLLKMDCVACHAQDTEGPNIVVLEGGSSVPQVYHGDTRDLAGGNFRHIADGANRKGHNVIDIFGVGDTENADSFGSPPGMHNEAVHGQFFSPAGGTFANFTCAGSVGCHGTRNQAGATLDTKGNTDPSDDEYVLTARLSGIAAISGAHHNSYDGKKEPPASVMSAGLHSGANVAASYRFILGLKGTGNVTARWQNLDSSSHNEYFSSVTPLESTTTCEICHVEGGIKIAEQLFTEGKIRLPNQAMGEFCITCHGNFHSVGQASVLGNNGASGAFLRHPSDYVIPNRGEYADYTEYAITAPVARPTLYDAASTNVAPGTDMVMCLSCHHAHASEHDGMLRFNYAAIVAGNTTGNVGCLACHTTKGTLPANR
jgi:nitrate/TMAO reductase-like tetraheme cytochrome c subunit